jgi:hypothetical protein
MQRLGLRTRTGTGTPQGRHRVGVMHTGNITKEGKENLQPNGSAFQHQVLRPVTVTFSHSRGAPCHHRGAYAAPTPLAKATVSPFWLQLYSDVSFLLPCTHRLPFLRTVTVRLVDPCLHQPGSTKRRLRAYDNRRVTTTGDPGCFGDYHRRFYEMRLPGSPLVTDSSRALNIKRSTCLGVKAGGPH